MFSDLEQADGLSGSCDPVLRFSSFTLHRGRRQLHCDGHIVPLGSRAFDLLAALAERPGEVLSKRELMARVWPATIVDESSLRVGMSALRRAVGPDVIATIPGRGYQLVASGLRAAPAATGALPAPASAPASTQRPGLFGRDAMLSRARALLQEFRVVTLTGAPGCGKTTLARALHDESEVVSRTPARWVDLSALADGAHICGNIVRACDLPVAKADDAAALATALTPLDLLLVLDNAEHLIGDVACLVRELIDSAPRLRVLVTSQAPLKLMDECVLPVSGLHVAPAGASEGEAIAAPATALFFARCAAAGRPLPVEAETVSRVNALCGRLDGLPLAIEFAAAAVPLLGLRGVAEALDERCLSLRTHRRDAPSRHRSLRATLQWSHALLQPEEQAAFRALGVFSGGCSAALYLLTVGSDGDDGWAWMGPLSELIDRSLVVAEGAVTVRYRLLDTSRAYAREEALRCGEAEALHRRHAQAVAAHFRRARHGTLEGHCSVDRAVDELLPDLDNARTAFQWSLRHDASTAVDLSVSLAFVLGHCGGALEAGRCLTDAEPLVTESLPPELGVAWALQASKHWYLRDLSRGLDWAHHALRAARQAGDRRWVSIALARLTSCEVMGTMSHTALLARRAELEGLDDTAWPLPMRAPAARALWQLRRMIDRDDRATDALRVAQAGWRGNETERLMMPCVEMDHWLRLGEPRRVVALGEPLRCPLPPARHRAALNFAMLNLAGAYLQLERWVDAVSLAEDEVPVAAANGFLYLWADPLALVHAMAGRPAAAARLAGFAEAGYRGAGTQASDVELAFRNQAFALATSALGPDTADAERLVGTLWTDAAAHDAMVRLTAVASPSAPVTPSAAAAPLRREPALPLAMAIEGHPA